MNAKHFLLLSFLLTCRFAASAQELNARVQLQAPAVSNIDKRNIDVLENVIREFLNTTKWTTEVYTSQERILCNFVITINEWDGNSNYKAEAQVQSSRPVFGTSYNSTLLNISDKDFDFTYIEGQSLDFSTQNYLSNLSSLLGFYAYTIIGLDKDSFGTLAGSKYYSSAQNLVNLAQASGSKGWKPSDGLRNRYWLNENLLNKNFNDLRVFIYDYHVKGLDHLHENPISGSKELITILSRLKRLDKQRIGSIFPNSFLAAKTEEIVNIFSMPNIEPTDKVKVYNILAGIDPANLNKYDALRSE